MDKLKNVAKGGWHPSGDKQIHRDSWKSDLKGIATGKKSDPYAQARENHQSRPLSSLKDPDSFGPPPRHTGAYGTPAIASSSTTPTQSRVGNQGPQSDSSAASQYAKLEGEDDTASTPSLPYRTNTTGLRTDNLPKPPVRQADAVQRNNSPRPTASPALPPRQPPRSSQPQTQRPPILPPRQNEFPDEYTPAPPPPYTEATQSNETDPAFINRDSVTRLSQAGISVPGFGIGPQSTSSNSTRPTVQGSQLNELQARFARMNAGNQNEATSPQTSTAPTVQKKGPPAPPPKKATLASIGQQAGRSSPSEATGSYPTPPPLPLGSKPRPT